MSRKKEEKVDFVQTELDDLQRTFRDMEAKHRLMNDDSVQTIRMQRQKIAKLKRDNERLKEELALETRQAKMSLTQTSYSSKNNVSKLSENGDMYQRKIEIEKRRIAELDAQIKKMEESILQQRSDMGGVNANRETSRTIQKNIRMLENRLDKALVKYNEALGHNKKLRETIDNLRRERVVFDGIYRKLQGDLEKIKNEMALIIEQSNNAYEQRDLAQAEMSRLKEIADKEQKQFDHEWKELSKLIDQDRKMKDFLSTKDREKMNDAVVHSVLEQEQQLRKKLSKGAWSIVKDKAHIHMAEEKVKSYKEAFEQIKRATKINNIDELVGTFIQSEEANFKLFNQVNNVSNEIERLEESIQHLQKEINKIKGETSVTGNNDTSSADLSNSEMTNNTENNTENNNENKNDTKENANNPIINDTSNYDNDNQRKQILSNLKNKIQETQNKTNYYEKKHKDSVVVMESLTEGITKILEKIDIDENILNMVKVSKVTQSNIMELLGNIEQKTNQYIEDYLSLDTTNKDNTTDSDKPIINDINQPILNDKEAEFAALGVGIGAGSLQPLVMTPAAILDDFSDASEDELNDEEPNN